MKRYKVHCKVYDQNEWRSWDSDIIVEANSKEEAKEKAFLEDHSICRFGNFAYEIDKYGNEIMDVYVRPQQSLGECLARLNNDINNPWFTDYIQ